MGAKCLAQEHKTVPLPGLEPGPFDPESSALTIRPPLLLIVCSNSEISLTVKTVHVAIFFLEMFGVGEVK